MLTKEWNKIEQEAIKIVKNSRGEINPYHNSAHALECLSRLNSLLEVTQTSIRMKNIMRLAMIFHDYDHCGKSIKTDEHWKNGSVEDGLTNEEWAAHKATDFACEHGFIDSDIQLMKSSIIATTFAVPKNREVVQPRGLLEYAIALSDVGGFIGTWNEWVTESARVLAEIEQGDRPKNVAEWLYGREKFINLFLLQRLDTGIVLATKDGQEILGKKLHQWRKKLIEQKRIVLRLRTQYSGPESDVVEKFIMPLL